MMKIKPMFAWYDHSPPALRRRKTTVATFKDECKKLEKLLFEAREDFECECKDNDRLRAELELAQNNMDLKDVNFDQACEDTEKAIDRAEKAEAKLERLKEALKAKGTLHYQAWEWKEKIDSLEAELERVKKENTELVCANEDLEVEAHNTQVKLKAELERARNPWISVEERLPTENGDYFTLDDIGPGVNEWDGAMWDSYRAAKYVTHWMPVPPLEAGSINRQVVALSERQGVNDMTEYQERDGAELEPHYSKHVNAMTEEKLHRKSAIAAELAHRDKRIAELEAELEQAKNPWISVAERLPTENGDYFTLDDIGPGVNERYVTHWMPVPPLKEGSE